MHTTIMIRDATLRETFLGRASPHLENLALRQQVAVLRRERRRPWLQTLDRLSWVIRSRLWPRWPEALVIVKPETVIGWYRKGCRARVTAVRNTGDRVLPERILGTDGNRRRLPLEFRKFLVELFDPFQPRPARLAGAFGYRRA